MGEKLVEKLIREQYGLRVAETFRVGNYDAFSYHQHVYLIVPLSHIDDEELYELYNMSQFLLERGDPFVAVFLLTKQGNLYIEWEKRKYGILKTAYVQSERVYQVGRELARFHQKARSYPYQVSKISRIGQWKVLWEKRTDQLEGFWRGKISSQPLDSFEKMFAESFPYYMGLAENAIQYLVDTELDDEPQPIDSATVCHHRFYSDTWRSSGLVKIPTDWVFDHCSRDIAEYLRNQFFDQPEILRQDGFLLLEDYDRTTPLSSFSWRLIYSRLLLPIHYFECIEDYYLSSETDKPYYEAKLSEMLKNSSKYEGFLKSYAQLLSMRTKKIYLPAIHWL
ncbi:spore coat protein YutH [Peribacillus frigoritolerans]|nr:spore coat protein YutH [Peribacillus frigoritolerans]